MNLQVSFLISIGAYDTLLLFSFFAFRFLLLQALPEVLLRISVNGSLTVESLKITLQAL